MFYLNICFDKFFLQNGPTTTDQSANIAPIATDNPVLQPSNVKEDSRRQPTPTPFSQIVPVSDSTKRKSQTDLKLATEGTQFNYDDHWEEIQVVLQRVNHSRKIFLFCF